VEAPDDLPKWLISYPMVAALLLMAGVAALDLAGLRLTSPLSLALGFFQPWAAGCCTGGSSPAAPLSAARVARPHCSASCCATASATLSSPKPPPRAMPFTGAASR
jgi:hypothetical protein